MRTRLRVAEEASARNYNMSSLSRKANISFNTVKRMWQHPFNDASIDTLGKVAEALGINVGMLVEMVEEEEDK